MPLFLDVFEVYLCQYLHKKQKNFHRLIAVGVVRNKCVIVSLSQSSQHQHFKTIGIILILKLSSLEIPPFRTPHKKKLILKGTFLNTLFDSFSFLLFRF